MEATWKFALAVVLAISQANSLSPNGTNVCSTLCQRSFKERVQSFKRCGLFGWRRCAHYTYQTTTRNDTCYQCCPGWIQSDTDNCATPEPCPTGLTGIRSCAELPDGNYQSCDQCHVYSTCSAGRMKHSPCCCGLVWNDATKRCDWTSKTCQQSTSSEAPRGTSTPHYTPTVTSGSPELTTSDPDGIVCGPGSGCWVRYNFRYDDNWNDCHGERYVRRSGHTFAKYVGVILCSEERYKIFLADHLRGLFQNVADGNGDGRDHCEFVGGNECHKGVRVASGYWKSPLVYGFYRDEWGQEPRYGPIGRGWLPGPKMENPKQDTKRYYVRWYQCDVHVPGNNTIIDYVTTTEGLLPTKRPVTRSTSVTRTSRTFRTSNRMSTVYGIESTKASPIAQQTVLSTKFADQIATTTEGRRKTTPRTTTDDRETLTALRMLTDDMNTGSGSGSPATSAGSGSRGPTCDVITCTPPSVCVDLYGDDEDEPFSKCVCPPGMATLPDDPEQCLEVDECQSSPCLNDGECLDRRGGYVCNCAPGWQGTHCDILEFEASQRPHCNHCGDYGRLLGSCEGEFCECRKARYNTYTCLPEVGLCTVLRNQSTARGRPELMIDRPVGVVYSCVSSSGSEGEESPKYEGTDVKLVRDQLDHQHQIYEVHALAVYRSTKGSVVVNITWPNQEEEQSNMIDSVENYVILALANYWPTSWTVVIPQWRQLSEVIVFSHAHRNTTVSVRRGHPDGGLVPVNTFHLHPASYPPGFGDDTHRDTNTPAMLDYLYTQYGRLASFTGTYQADRWQLNVGSGHRNS